jgi:hypothetical protein
MAGKVFQVQAKDSVVRFNAFEAINAIQNLNLDPRFNEEYYTELGNPNYTTQSRQPETEGSFEVTATGSIPATLARMLFNYTTQTYLFDPGTKGNTFTISETDLEFCIFDLVNLKQPGQSFTDATLVPNAQLIELGIRVDSTGTASETYRFAADLQESFYTPYCDMVSVPLTTLTSGTAQIPAGYTGTVNSGTHAIMYVFRDNQKFTSAQASFTASDTITVPTGAFTTTAPKDRVHAVLYKRTVGTMPTIYYPTTARFVRGDRADVWLIVSGTAGTDLNRMLRCTSVDLTVPLTRDRLTEIRRNNDLSTTYYRGLNYPLQIAANVTLNETTLQQWATLQGKTLVEGAPVTPIQSMNVMNLADFSAMKLIIKYYVRGNDTPLCTVTMDNVSITAFGERQAVGTRAERTLSYTGSEIDIVGTNN